MSKIIFLILIIFLIYFLFFSKKKKINKKDTEEMVECKHCGTYVSIHESYKKNGNYFCCKKCIKENDDNYRS